MKDNTVLILVGFLAVGGVGAAVYFGSRPQAPKLSPIPETGNVVLPSNNASPILPMPAPGVPTFTKGQQCSELLAAVRNHDTAIESARQRMEKIVAEAKPAADALAAQAECRYVFGICGGYGGVISDAAVRFVRLEIASIFAGLNPDEDGAKLIRDNPSWSAKLKTLRERYQNESDTFNREVTAKENKLKQIEKLRSEGVIC